MAMMENLPTESITAAIKFLAFQNKLSQTKLAKSAGMSQSAVHRRLAGGTDLSLSDLEHLAAALGHEVRISLVPRGEERVA